MGGWQNRKRISNHTRTGLQSCQQHIYRQLYWTRKKCYSRRNWYLHCRTTVFSKNVINYIEEHYHEYITSHSIAEDMHYHQSYFCRLFKKVFGLCFNEYLCLLRLEKAKELLINSPDTSITDIAFEAGFSNLSYFSKKFREQYKMSPNRFRQNNAGDTIRRDS